MAKTQEQKERYKRYLLAMYEKDITQTDIAKMLKVSVATICNVMWGKRKSARLEKAINQILDIRGTSE